MATIESDVVQVPVSQSAIRLEGIDHVALAVRDVERSMRWYIDVLGFEHRAYFLTHAPLFVERLQKILPATRAAPILDLPLAWQKPAL